MRYNNKETIDITDFGKEKRMKVLSISVPERFWKEEVRSGYQVTEERKQLWAVEIDLLCQLDRVCRKHKLHYCVGAGTLLGAVRHAGFIPWDNDLDVYMLRPYYNKLMKLKNEFSKKYHLQNSYTERGFYIPHAKLRNTETTGYVMVEKDLDIQKGVFIDIFPLDGVCIDYEKNNKQREKNRSYINALEGYNHYVNNKSDVFISKLASSCVADLAKQFVFTLYDRNLMEYSKKETKIWGNRTLVFDCPKSGRPLQDYMKLKWVPFEFIKVPIPVNYDELLTQQYGNYMRIPKNENGSMHGKMFFSMHANIDDLEQGCML